MNHNRVAFICPLYDLRNHFILAENLLKSKLELGVGADLIFVFSNEEQKTKFENQIKNNLHTNIEYLIIPECLRKYKSQVTIKKFYALKTLMGKYEYYGTIDSEQLFLKGGDYYCVFDEIWNSQSFLNANVSLDGFGILRTTYRTLGLYYNRVIRKETDSFKYNIWFNEIPTYKDSTLPDFFEWVAELDVDSIYNVWNCFEYYVYITFLILKKDYHIKKHPDIISNGGVMEYLFERPEEEQYKILEKLGTHWTSSPRCVTDNIYMQFHLDREAREGNYSYGLSKESIREKNRERIKLLIKDFILDHNILAANSLKRLKLKVQSIIKGRN